MQVRDWLAVNHPQHAHEAGGDWLARARRWQKRKFDARWACLGWPEAYGGRGASPIQQVIWSQEERVYDPPNGVFSIGIGMAAPTLMNWGDPERNAVLLPRMARGEDIWCQLFSEPAAGSDLAGIRTRARREGDDWVVNGHKIWTSGAHYSAWGILLARTNPEVPKHEGLTFFILRMDSPGIEIRPIRQITGESLFNEVFFTDVRIPDSQRIGPAGQGWKVALTTLMNERVTVDHGGNRSGFEALFELAGGIAIDGRPAIENPGVRAKLADWYVQEAGLRFSGYRTISALSRGDTPGPENSISKLVGAAKTQDMASFAMDLLEMQGVLAENPDDPATGRFPAVFMDIPGIRIAGGSDEILLNIIAERVLGLPQEPRVDKGVAFNQIDSGGKKR